MSSWERDPAFRAFVDAEREAGRLTQAEIATIAALPHRLNPKDATSPAVLVPLKRAYALLRASGADDRLGEWKDWTGSGWDLRAP